MLPPPASISPGMGILPTSLALLEDQQRRPPQQG